MLSTQLESYKGFLQAEVPAEERNEVGLHGAFKSVFPIISYSGHVFMEYVSYRLGEPAFDVKECKIRGLTYSAPLRVLVRLVVYEKETVGKTNKVKRNERTRSLYGRTAIDD